MATAMLPIRPAGVGARPITGKPKLDVGGRKSSSGNWWSPIFGWSAEPDYIDTEPKSGGVRQPEVMDQGETAKPRVVRGSFTAEKARQLRKLTTESSTFHDVMYHSAIASRLASDFSER